MFTRVCDASKTAFAVFADTFFNRMGGSLIDSQVYTDHIARFGGMNISRSAYLRKIRDLLAGKESSSIIHPGLWQNVHFLPASSASAS